MFEQLKMRLAFEDAVVAQLLEMGYPAAAGMSLIPASMRLESEEEMLRIIKKEGFDLVIMSSIFDEQTEVQYHSTTSSYNTGAWPYYNYGVYDYYNYRYGYNAYYGSYYSGVGYYEQGYYTEETNFLIESHIYDIGESNANDHSFVYRAQGQISSSSNLRKSSQKYAEKLLTDLINNQFLKDKTDESKK